MANIFSVTLTGAQEVPGVTTAAFGAGTVVWDERDSTASYSISVTGIDFGIVAGIGAQTPDVGDNLRNMHVHNGARGANGPVVFGQFMPNQDDDDVSYTLNADGSWTVRGVWETTDPANQPITNFAAVLSAALVGADVPLYFNVHSEEFPAGEVRGQWVAAGGRFTGTGADDTITVLPGLALVAEGRGGNDSITGGDLADLLLGGTGNDTLEGNAGDDTIKGCAGDDSINAGLGNDLVLGGSGDDTIGGMAGRDTVRGGAGDDFIAWNDPTGDLVRGGGGDDTIIGGDVAADTIFGGAGDDFITAFATAPAAASAADALSGNAGDDTIVGGDAADTIEGGAGDDTLTGNGGADVFVFRRGQSTGVDIITDFTGGDVVRLERFGGFDPLAALSASGADTRLDLGDGDAVLFLGRAPGEFAAGDFVLA